MYCKGEKYEEEAGWIKEAARHFTLWSVASCIYVEKSYKKKRDQPMLNRSSSDCPLFFPK
jgi:hypothetical protein